MEHGVMRVTRQFELAIELLRAPGFHYPCVPSGQLAQDLQPILRQMTPGECAARALAMAEALFEGGKVLGMVEFTSQDAFPTAKRYSENLEQMLAAANGREEQLQKVIGRDQELLESARELSQQRADRIAQLEAQLREAEQRA